MLPIDLPTMDQFKRLSQMRADGCVSIYLETDPLTQSTDVPRIELRNLLRAACQQLLDAGFDKARLAAIQEPIEDLIDDDEFWRFQANSLALLATPDQLLTFRLANQLRSQVEVSDRFHLKPLLRALTFPHAAFLLALSENEARLLEILASGPPVAVKVPGMPKDAASAAGKASINDRSPSGRIHGSEGKKIRLSQYARKVDAALRPILAGQSMPLLLAAAEPIASIYRHVDTSLSLVAETIPGNPDRVADLDLAAAARAVLDRLYAAEVASFRNLFAARAAQRRTTTDIALAARAVTQGAVDALLIDIDEVIPGTVDETSGAIAFADGPGKESYGIVDEIAGRALGTGARVLAVRKGDIPDGASLAAILRYPL